LLVPGFLFLSFLGGLIVFADLSLNLNKEE